MLYLRRSGHAKNRKQVAELLGLHRTTIKSGCRRTKQAVLKNSRSAGFLRGVRPRISKAKV